MSLHTQSQQDIQRSSQGPLSENFKASAMGQGGLNSMKALNFRHNLNVSLQQIASNNRSLQQKKGMSALA
jgi:hypothetical protein